MTELQSVRDAVAVVTALHRGDVEAADLLIGMLGSHDQEALIGSLAAIASTLLDAYDRVSPGSGDALMQSLALDLAHRDTPGDIPPAGPASPAPS